MSTDKEFSQDLGKIYDRLTRIETMMEEQRRLDHASSIGPRLQALEVAFATMQGKMIGIGAVVGLATGIIIKFI